MNSYPPSSDPSNPYSPYAGPAAPAPVNRPGCVTAYAILLWIGGALYALGALCVGFSGVMGAASYGSASDRASTGAASMGILLVIAACIGLFALVPIITGVGLWKMKNWAWWLVVIFQSLGLAGALLSLCANVLVFASASGRQSSSAVVGLLGALIGGAISGGIVYWFITNRALFNGGQVTGGGGTGMVIAIVLAVVGVVVVIPIVVIVILALLGPAIGNVFSNIMLSV